ncbi:hypothetical protein ColKHC_14340 [Colletotrichum higginsianum]|nr:hypothetical protein ColKHC_14340 [Colletotrichum higginsianum]
MERRRREALEKAVREAKEKAARMPRPAGNNQAPEATTADAGANAENKESKVRVPRQAHIRRTPRATTRQMRARKHLDKCSSRHPATQPDVVIKIFVARECSSKTFQNTISAIKNLSAIPGAKATSTRASRVLSENIVADLDELLPHIEKATSGTEIQGVALAKFSPVLPSKTSCSAFSPR